MGDTEQDIRLGMGGNAPPELMVPTAADIREHLQRETKGLEDRASELTPMLTKFPERVPEIKNDDDQAMAANIVAQVKGHLKLIEERRKSEKEPWLDGGRTIDEFFRNLGATLNTKPIEDMQTAYAKQKAAAAQQEKEDAARRARERADRLADIAAETLDPANLTRAEEAMAEAYEAERQANAGAAEHSRVRTDYNVVSSLAGKLCVRILDVRQVPEDLLLLNETEAKRRFNAAKRIGQKFTTPGLEFYYDQTIRNIAR